MKNAIWNCQPFLKNKVVLLRKIIIKLSHCILHEAPPSGLMYYARLSQSFICSYISLLNSSAPLFNIYFTGSLYCYKQVRTAIRSDHTTVAVVLSRDLFIGTHPSVHNSVSHADGQRCRSSPHGSVDFTTPLQCASTLCSKLE